MIDLKWLENIPGNRDSEMDPDHLQWETESALPQTRPPLPFRLMILTTNRALLLSLRSSVIYKP